MNALFAKIRGDGELERPLVCKSCLMFHGLTESYEWVQLQDPDLAHDDCWFCHFVPSQTVAQPVSQSE